MLSYHEGRGLMMEMTPPSTFPSIKQLLCVRRVGDGRTLVEARRKPGSCRRLRPPVAPGYLPRVGWWGSGLDWLGAQRPGRQSHHRLHLLHCP